MNIKLLIVASALFCQVALAEKAEVENPITEDGVVTIEWHNPKKFRDLDSSLGLQSRFEQHFFDVMTKNINKEAVKILKPDQKLIMTVTDVDLAGDLRPTFGATSNDIRIVKDVYPPRIKFSYKVMQGETVVVSGEEKLRDMNFLHGITRSNQRPYEYETEMMRSWFKKTLSKSL